MRRVVASIGVALLVAACLGKDPYNPGMPLGTFHVVGKLQSNSCGGTAPDPWEFDVKLSRDKATLYWIQGGVPVQGTLDTKAHTTMISQGTTVVRDVDAALGKCALTRSDLLDTTLTTDPSDPNGASAFVGTLAYTFGQTDDSDCSDQLTMAGGGFDALPCTARYSITGTRTVLPK